MMTEADKEFQLALTRCFETDSDDERNELWDKIVDMWLFEDITTYCATQTFSQILDAHGSTRLALILTVMSDLVDFRKDNGYYDFPELFWAIFNSNLLSDVDDIYNYMRSLCKITPPATLRAFLAQRLIAEPDPTIQHNIVQSFYYVGQTVENLRVIRQVVPLTTENLDDVYQFVYSHAMSHVFSTDLEHEDRQYLIAFFEEGLTLGHHHIVKDSEKGLKQLRKLANEKRALLGRTYLHLAKKSDLGNPGIIAQFEPRETPPPTNQTSNVNCVPFVDDKCVVITLDNGNAELPGGTLEPAETPIWALRRELNEEAGAKLLNHHPLGAWFTESSLPEPFRPHLPHPKAYRYVVYGDVELVGDPTNVGEQVVKVETVSIDEAAARFVAAGRPDLAELYQLAADVRSQHRAG